MGISGMHVKKKKTCYLCVACLAIILLVNGYKHIINNQFEPTKTSDTAAITTAAPSSKRHAAHYVQQNETTLQTRPLKGFIIYDCDDQHPGGCGGWSDRMSGMFSVYVISVMLSKQFLIKYTRSGILTDFLRPNSFDWRYDSSILTARSSVYLDFFCKVPDAITKQDLTGLYNLFSKDVNFVRMNWDYTEHFRKFRGVQNVIPWIQDLHYADIYLKFFNTLFKPTDMITKAVNEVVENVNKLACAHIRMGGSDTIIGDDKHTDEEQLIHIWKLLKTKEAMGYSIFIATDAEFVRKRAKSLFKHLLETEGRIVHIDWGAEGEGLVSGYWKVVVDFFVLTKCDLLVLTSSGFGIMSSYLNTNVSDLYCLTPHAVVPCSRYTVHNFFPSELLSPY